MSTAPRKITSCIQSACNMNGCRYSEGMAIRYMSADELHEQGHDMAAGLCAAEKAAPDLGETFLLYKELKEIIGGDYSELANDLMASRRALTKLTIKLLKATSPAAATRAAKGGVATEIYLFDIEEISASMSAEISRHAGYALQAKKVLKLVEDQDAELEDQDLEA